MKDAYQILRLQYAFDGAEQTLFPVLLFGKEDIVLVDCGYPGSLALLEEQIRGRGTAPEAITKLVLTHQDDDHMGSAAAWKRKYPAAQVLASALEAPYISGKRKNLRLLQAEALQSKLPDDQKAWGERFCSRLRSLEPVAVDRTLQHGDMFDWGGGCEILLTPGHSPGHLSIRALDGSFCVTGDAAVREGTDLAVANPGFCLDLDEAEKSLAMLRRCCCKQYICCHGGIWHRQMSE